MTPINHTPEPANGAAPPAHGSLLTDICGVIVEADAVAVELFQTRKELLVGKPVALMLDGESRRTLYTWLLQLRKDTGQIANYEPLLIARPNRPVVEVSASVRAVCNDDGIPVALHWNLHDLTARRLTLHTHHHEQTLTDALFDAAQVIILEIGADGYICRSNAYAQHLTGYTWWELVDQDWRMLLAEGEQRAAEEFLQAATRQGLNSQLTSRLITHDGEARIVAWTAKAVKTANPLSPLVVIGHDITDWQQAQQRAIESTRLATIGQMTATIAHEARNALQRMSGNLERLAWRVNGQAELEEIVGRLRAANRDITRLFDDIRNYAGPVRLEPEPCQLQQIWRAAWQRAGEVFPGKKGELHEDTGGIDLHLTGDPFRLEQVFRNILENSLAASPEPVRIEVVCREGNTRGQSALQIAVRDNGPGLSAEQRMRIFEPFFTTKTHGSGLGMAIAKRIVEAHEGEIALGTPPQGTEIVITLPRR